jgi:hypothetical protein
MTCAAKEITMTIPSYDPRQVDAVVRADWQVLTILTDDTFVEINCNTGEKRHIRKSACKCGQAALIQLSGAKGRNDGKKVFYPDEKDMGWNAFRCKSCHEPVNLSIPGAEYFKL